jgi:[lysine-biosynthesis-protein LysW]--L-2-aminoadipate ligase
VLAVLASRVGADEKRLFEALERQRVPHRHIDTRTLWHAARHTAGAAPHQDSDDDQAGLAARPAFGAALNREIGQARAAYAARSLEARGVTVVNSAAATEVCGDKWRTTLALADAALPTPRTALGLTPQAALDALEQIGYPAVVKPLVGSWGRLIVPLADRAAAEAVFEYVAALPAPQSHLVYVQELIDKPGRDIRAIVVGGELLGAVYRTGPGLRTNVARGAQTRPCEESAQIAKLAVAAAAAVDAEIAGVDLIEDRDGRPLVLEVNHRVEFSGFQAALGERVDVAARIVRHTAALLARDGSPAGGSTADGTAVR